MALLPDPKPEKTAENHETTVCEREPYTAYFATGSWSCRYKCPLCGNVERVHGAGLSAVVCDGINMAIVKGK